MQHARTVPEQCVLLVCRRISAEDLREGLGAVGKQMDKESVKKLARELDVSGCGSINLEVGLCCPFWHLSRRFL
jgi:hypothetical protein